MLRTHPLHLAAGAAAAAVLATVSALPAAASSASNTSTISNASSTSSRWLSTWAASDMAATPASLASPDDFSSAGFADQTIRDIVWTSAGGAAARIRLSNRFGTQPVTFSQVDVGVSAGGAAVVPGTEHRASFGGKRRTVTIAPGAAVLSDPVPMAVPAETDLAVSLYTRGPTGPATYHSDAQQVNYVAAGDQAASTDGSAFTTTSAHWYFLDDIDVQVAPRPAVAGTAAAGAPRPAADAAPGPAADGTHAAGGTIVAFGDSITDGFGSTVNANRRWPNDLARRLLAEQPQRPHPVVDEGISGNRILNDSVCLGQNAQARFFRDVAARSGARYVIMLEGINDIGFSQLPDSGCAAPNTDVSAAQIIAGYRHIIAEAHAVGLRIFGGTLTPFEGAFYYSTAGEAKREAVNSWIRTSGAFDAVIDFDKAARDPADPLRLLPAYDSGDHLHPNDAGYQAMADAVNLALFRH